MTRRRRDVESEDCPYCAVSRGFPCLNYKRQPKQACDFRVKDEEEVADENPVRQITIDDWLRDKERK